MNCLLVAALLCGIVSVVSSLDHCLTSFRVTGQSPAGGVSRGQQQQGPPPQPVIEWIETPLAGAVGGGGGVQAFTVTVWVHHGDTDCRGMDLLRLSVDTPRPDPPPQTAQPAQPQGGQGGAPPPEDAVSMLVKYGPQGVQVTLDEGFGRAANQGFLPIPGGTAGGPGAQGLSPGWHHLAVSWSNLLQCGLLHVYVDGELIGQRKMPLQITPNFNLGTLSAVVNSNLGCDYTLQFTDVHMFRRALSRGEVGALATCATGGDPRLADGDLVSYRTSDFTRNPPAQPAQPAQPQPQRHLLVKRPLQPKCCDNTAPTTPADTTSKREF